MGTGWGEPLYIRFLMDQGTCYVSATLKCKNRMLLPGAGNANVAEPDTGSGIRPIFDPKDPG
jgi:hypothetical protein